MKRTNYFRGIAADSVWVVWLGALMLGGVLAVTPARGQAAPDDDFLRGYATSVLESRFRVHPSTLIVREGTLIVGGRDLEPGNREEIKLALEEIEGIRRVLILEEGDSWEGEAGKLAGRARPSSGGEFLPAGHLFRPLIADQRWPHFSATLQNYHEDDELENVGAVSLGATIPLYENDFFDGAGRWSLSVEGVVFSIFDLDTRSKDLVNSDYWAGIPMSYAWNGFSAVGRVYHQSSHLGDEYLLRNPVDRIDLNYEGLDFRLSYDFFGDLLRAYGGGGYIFSKNPDDLKPWSTQCGFELRCPRTFFKYFRPVAALDLQSREENDWDLDWSARVGVQLDAEKLQGRTLHILFEYFQGHSPNGQFFARDIEYLGVGVHFYL